MKLNVIRNLDESLKFKRELKIPKIIDANGNPIKSHGCFYIKCRVGQKKILAPFIVISEHSGIKKDFLLGTNIMRKFGMSVNFDKNILSSLTILYRINL